MFSNSITHKLEAFEGMAKEMERLQRPAINGLKKAKQKIEANITPFIASDEKMRKTIELIFSINGIGLKLKTLLPC